MTKEQTTLQQASIGLDEDHVREALRSVIDPELGENIVELGMVRGIEIESGAVRVEIALTIAGCPLRDQLRNDTQSRIFALDGVTQVDVVVGTMSKKDRSELMTRARRNAQRDGISLSLPSRTRVLAIMSGKGGVGKSSVTANLAVALAKRNVSVGLLDGDIWGFSIPRLLGVEGRLEVRNNKMIPKQVRFGGAAIKVISMGFLSGEDEAIMWRGLVLNRAVQHFLEDVHWGPIDYLLVDMPPGTGDVQMGLARMLPRTELLVVTTPGIAAQKVAGRAADMARKGNLRVAGVIENMSGFTCEHGETYPLFGSGGGRRLADEIGAPLLASIPIDPRIATGGDKGVPAVADNNSPLSSVFDSLAEKIVTTVAPIVPMSGCSARIIEDLKQAQLDATGS